jgi:tetratricopeptide (TPR) repeat protein
MILPKNRFTFSSADREGTEIGARKIAGVILGVLVFFSILGAVIFRDEIRPFGALILSNRDDLFELWESGEYDKVSEVTDRIFNDDPMDKTSLVLGGFAQFYQGVYEIDAERKQTHMDRSVVLLRKALLHQRPPMQAQVFYVLGKAYFHKGSNYYDLAVEYIEDSLDAGYVASDSYEYLTVAYGELDMLEKSAETLHSAIELNPNDLLYFSLGETYFQMQRYDDALGYYDTAIHMSDDEYLEQQARFRIGEIYLDQGFFEESEAQIQRVLDENPRSAQAHYLLGELSNARGDHERARFYWREAVRIDPGHIDSLRSLQSN